MCAFGCTPRGVGAAPSKHLTGICERVQPFPPGSPGNSVQNIFFTIRILSKDYLQNSLPSSSTTNLISLSSEQVILLSSKVYLLLLEIPLNRSTSVVPDHRPRGEYLTADGLQQ
ncbi:hypothetical protein CEXT_89981 [Caerostris extrusa]|uniref:Uncharacterized protein n=1 Tax=Caerostris extrusa TaxID=172846 RepID=A0AAV4WU68_CAEEX|nr:hypothetical protein CEXT_89981 [Caerostris extrusa]